MVLRSNDVPPVEKRPRLRRGAVITCKILTGATMVLAAWSFTLLLYAPERPGWAWLGAAALVTLASAAVVLLTGRAR